MISAEDIRQGRRARLQRREEQFDQGSEEPRKSTPEEQAEKCTEEQ